MMRMAQLVAGQHRYPEVIGSNLIEEIRVKFVGLETRINSYQSDYVTAMIVIELIVVVAIAWK